MELRSLHLAAEQRAEADFKLEGRGLYLRLLAGRADRDVGELDPRGRQDAGLDRPVHADGEPGEAARLLLEARTVPVPIDHKRRGQRRDQRQDDSDSQSEQRRLHGASEPFLVGCTKPAHPLREA